MRPPLCGLQLDVDLYMRVQAAIVPDVYQALCDCDTDGTSGKKRLLKSVERTLHFLDKCLEKHSVAQVAVIVYCCIMCLTQKCLH